ERRDPRDADGRAHRAVTEGPPVRVGDDHAEPHGVVRLEGDAERRGARLGVGGEQEDPGAGANVLSGRARVGGVDARIGRDEAEAMPRDEHAAALARDPDRFAQHALHEGRVLVDLLRERERLGARRHRREIHEAPLGAGEELGGDDEDVVILERAAARLERGDHELGDRIPGPHQRDAAEGLELEPLTDARFGHALGSPTMRMPAPSAPYFLLMKRSTGVSDSSAMAFLSTPASMARSPRSWTREATVARASGSSPQTSTSQSKV